MVTRFVFSFVSILCLPRIMLLDINNGEVIDEPAPVQSICGEETFLLTDAGMSFVNESRDFTVHRYVFKYP